MRHFYVRQKIHTGSLPAFHEIPALFKGLFQNKNRCIHSAASIHSSTPPSLCFPLLNRTERGRGGRKRSKKKKELRYRNLLVMRTSGKLPLEFFPSIRSVILCTSEKLDTKLHKLGRYGAEADQTEKSFCYDGGRCVGYGKSTSLSSFLFFRLCVFASASSTFLVSTMCKDGPADA